LGGAFLRGPLDAVGKRLVGGQDVNSLDFPGFKMRISVTFHCAGCKMKAKESVSFQQRFNIARQNNHVLLFCVGIIRSGLIDEGFWICWNAVTYSADLYVSI
jgi:hypothetical protein